MQIATAMSDADGVVTLSGRFDSSKIDAVRLAVDDLLDGSDSLTFDLGQVTFIDEHAVAFLVETLMRCRDAGGDLALHQVSAPVDLVLRLTKLRNVFGAGVPRLEKTA